MGDLFWVNIEEALLIRESLHDLNVNKFKKHRSQGEKGGKTSLIITNNEVNLLFLIGNFVQACKILARKGDIENRLGYLGGS